MFEENSSIVRLKDEQTSNIRDGGSAMFQKLGTVAPKRLRPKTKRTAASVEEMEKVLPEGSSFSLWKVARNVRVNVCTLWKILRKNITVVFIRVTMV